MSSPGKRIPGEEAGFDEHRWKRDAFLDLYNDDALWAYMIRCSEEFHHQDWTEINNPVFCCLMLMGIFKWDKDDKQLNQTKPVMRFVIALGSWLMAHILEGDEWVRVSRLVILRQD